MTSGNSILIEDQGHIATIWFNRPELHNAFNGTMIDAIREGLKLINADPAVRIIVIRGKGPAFCSGADLVWMQESAKLTADDNLRECTSLARCFYEIATSPKITLALVQGSAWGGAGGFIAASDFALASASTDFAFSEVRLGLVPATIAPYVIRKIGYARAMELMLTGRKFDAREAEQIGFITRRLPDEEFPASVQSLIDTVLSGAPEAQKEIKTMLNSLQEPVIRESLVEATARLIAEVRTGSEAIEGIKAFLQKRKPLWKADNYRK